MFSWVGAKRVVRYEGRVTDFSGQRRDSASTCVMLLIKIDEGRYSITYVDGPLGYRVVINTSRGFCSSLILTIFFFFFIDCRQGRSFQEKLESGSQRALTWAALAGISSTKVSSGQMFAN